MARYCLGALLGRLGGRRLLKTSKNPTRKAKFGEKWCKIEKVTKPLRLSAKMDVQHAKAQKNVTAGKLQKWPNCCTCRQKWTRQATNVQKITHEKWPNHRTGAQK